jgi:hypothetical protein
MLLFSLMTSSRRAVSERLVKRLPGSVTTGDVGGQQGKYPVYGSLGWVKKVFPEGYFTEVADSPELSKNNTDGN